MDGIRVGPLLWIVLVLWTARADGLGVRVREGRTLAVLGGPANLWTELDVGRGERLHSITWRVEREGQGPVRILQHIVAKNSTLLSTPYGSRVHFDPDTGSLRLLVFTAGDCGRYRITVTAANGVEARDQTRLDIYEPVGSLYVSVATNWTSALDNLTLSCRVMGGSDVRVVWEMDGRNVTDRSRLLSREHELELFLPQLSASHCGVFTCRAWNQLNRQSSSLYLADYLDMPQCRSVSEGSVRARLLLLGPALFCCLLLAGALACSLTDGKKALMKTRSIV